MRARGFLPTLTLCLTLAACGGGSGGPPASSAPGSSAPASTVTPTAAADPGVVGLFRACHRTRSGSLILVFLFEDHDTARAADPANGFVVTAVTPTTWSSNGKPVVVAPGYNDHVRQVEVPAGQVAPTEMLLHVAVETTATGAVLATNDVTVHVPSSSCATA
jgi:hypothetical protein